MNKFLPNIKVEFVTISSAHQKDKTKAIKLTIQHDNNLQPEVRFVDLEEILSEIDNFHSSHIQELSDKIFQELFNKLTSREQQVLSYVAKGESSIEIAEKLFISSNTVKNHRRNMKKKLELYDPVKYSRFLRWILVNIATKSLD
jgi:DNA-binding NarL/FixJ family response regulator